MKEMGLLFQILSSVANHDLSFTNWKQKRERQVRSKVKNKIKQQHKRELEMDTVDHGVEESRKLYPAM